MRKFYIVYLVVLFLEALFALDTLERIEFSGLKSVSESYVLDQLDLELGQIIDADVIDAVTKSLYGSRMFEDVNVSYNQGEMRIDVKENLILAGYKFTGVGYFRNDEFKDTLEHFGLKEGDIIYPYHIMRLEQLIKHYYKEQGYLNISVEINSQPIETGHVLLHIHVNEGNIALIKDISITGNDSFNRRSILKAVDLDVSKSWNIFQVNDIYSENRYLFSKDMLEDFYLRQGYYDFKWIEDQVNVDDAGVSISWDIDEGSLYYFGLTDLSIDIESLHDRLYEIMNRFVQPGEVALRDDILEAKSQVESYLRNNGYAFANVDILSGRSASNLIESSEQRQYLDLKFNVDAGRLYRIRRINFYGNQYTSGELFRKFLPVYEGMVFSEDLLDQSTWKLNSKTYIKDARWDILPVEGVDNAVDVTYSMTEASKQNFMLKLGFSSVDRAFTGVKYDINNFLGQGISSGLDTTLSNYSQELSFYIKNPHLYGGNWGSYTGINFRRSNTDKTSVTDYLSRDFSVTQGISYWLNDYNDINLSVGYVRRLMQNNANPSQDFLSFIDVYGSGINQVNVAFGWDYSQLNRAIMPQEGTNISLNSAVYNMWAAGGDSTWFSTSLKAMHFIPLIKAQEAQNDLIFFVAGTFGAKFAANGKSEVPFYNRFYGGGNGSVRAYKPDSLGLKDINGDARGGDYLTELSLNLVVPNFLSDDLRTSLFVDAGQVHLSKIKLKDIRYSLGVNLEYTLPGLGLPMTLSIGRGLNPDGIEKRKNYIFDLGFTF